MAKNKYNVIGVMSGTSLDGIDLVYVTLYTSTWKFEINEAATVPYTDKWRQILSQSVNLDEYGLQRLDMSYTELLADEISKFIKDFGIKNIDAVCSHGHTVLHRPEEQITYQIGNKQILAEKLNLTLVCDFRVQDVMLGGQGAPLVPIGDRLLFNDYDCCINLGGFANISFEREDQRLAFDICPVNVVLNHYCRSIGVEYDDRGTVASGGNISESLLKDLNSLAFYASPPPKSLGMEWVNDHVFPLIESYGLVTEDILRTFVEHIAQQVSLVLTTGKRTMITGGGAYNEFLISQIKKYSSAQIIIPSSQLIEYKEALIFGLLGVLRLQNQVNCLSSVTGALRDHCSGKIFVP